MDTANSNRASNDPYLVYGDINFGGKIILDSIAVHHYKPFTGRNPASTYQPGWWQLEQGRNFVPNPYIIWQYYIFDQDNQRVALPANTSFTVQSVRDNWKIVWRLITIRNKPKALHPRLQGGVPKELAEHILRS